MSRRRGSGADPAVAGRGGGVVPHQRGDAEPPALPRAVRAGDQDRQALLLDAEGPAGVAGGAEGAGVIIKRPNGKWRVQVKYRSRRRGGPDVRASRRRGPLGDRAEAAAALGRVRRSRRRSDHRARAGRRVPGVAQGPGVGAGVGVGRECASRPHRAGLRQVPDLVGHASHGRAVPGRPGGVAVGADGGSSADHPAGSVPVCRADSSAAGVAGGARAAAASGLEDRQGRRGRPLHDRCAPRCGRHPAEAVAGAVPTSRWSWL